MAKFVKLNPYKDISTAIDTFFERVYGDVETLMLRDDVVFQGKLREMSLTKGVVLDDMLIGMININVMNEKYNQQNWVTDRYSASSLSGIDPTQGTNAEALNVKFADDRDVLVVRVSFSQFESKALAQSPVRWSTIFKTFSSDSDRVKIAIATKEGISYMWEDPAIVLATKEYYKLVKPVLEGWTPTKDDVTVQTLFVR